MRESNLRPSRRYSLKEHGNTSNENNMGNHVLKRSSMVEYWRPSWDHTKTCIRIFPGLNPDNHDEFDVFRLSDDNLDFGDFIRTYPAVRNFGDPGITMLLNDPASEEIFDPASNPCWILYRAIENACKNGTGQIEWFKMREFANGRGRILSKPTQLGLVQCALFCHKSKDYFTDKSPPRGGAKEDKTVVFELSSSTMRALFDLLEQKNEDWKGDTEDWMSQYKYGDIVSLDKGGYVWFYEGGTDFGDAKKATPKSAFGGSRGKEDGGDKFKGYECRITPDFKGVPAEIGPDQEDMVRGKVKAWDDILQFYTNEEQAHLLNGAFPASAILYAFRDHPEWIDSQTKRSAVGTKTVDMHQEPEPETSRPPRTGWSRPATSKPEVVSTPPASVKEDNVVPEGGIDDDNSDEADATPRTPAISSVPSSSTSTRPAAAIDALNNARARADSRRRRPSTAE